MFRYFVSYAHPRGFGRCYADRERPIAGIGDIEEIEQAIRASNGFNGFDD
jgi:hypothetical protein